MARCRLAAALLAVACVAVTARGADDVIAVSGMDELKELAAKHPFLVVEVRENIWVCWLVREDEAWAAGSYAG